MVKETITWHKTQKSKLNKNSKSILKDDSVEAEVGWEWGKLISVCKKSQTYKQITKTLRLQWFVSHLPNHNDRIIKGIVGNKRDHENVIFLDFVIHKNKLYYWLFNENRTKEIIHIPDSSTCRLDVDRDTYMDTDTHTEIRCG